jgi:hypothetical protein
MVRPRLSAKLTPLMGLGFESDGSVFSGQSPSRKVLDHAIGIIGTCTPITAVYQSYFRLAEAPFSIAPNPRYLYMSKRHQEALAHLLYGVNGSGGFVLLTGEVGAGKTTVCRCLLEQIPESCDVAYIFNPRQTVEELLATICAEFGIAVPPGNTSVKVFVDCIKAPPRCAPSGAVLVSTRRRFPRISWSRCVCSPILKPTSASCCRSS